MPVNNQTVIVPATDYKPATDVQYTKPKVNASGGKSVGVLNKSTSKATYLSTPLMLTWGVNENDFDGSGKFNYDLSLQFPSDEWSSPATDSFLNAMVEFEAKIKADAIVNAKDWFNKPKMSPEVVDALFTPMLRYPKDKETGDPDLTRSPTLRVKIPYWDGDFKTEIYNLEGQPLYPSESDDTPMSLIPKGVNIATVIQCGGIWFANGKFGVTWRLFQAVVKPKSSLKGTCHISLSTDEVDKLNTQATSDAEEEEEEDNVEVADSDEEEDVAVKIDPIVAEPTPVPKKKIVRRKADTKTAAATA